MCLLYRENGGGAIRKKSLWTGKAPIWYHLFVHYAKGRRGHETGSSGLMFPDAGKHYADGSTAAQPDIQRSAGEEMPLALLMILFIPIILKHFIAYTIVFSGSVLCIVSLRRFAVQSFRLRKTKPIFRSVPSPWKCFALSQIRMNERT